MFMYLNDKRHEWKLKGGSYANAQERDQHLKRCREEWDMRRSELEPEYQARLEESRRNRFGQAGVVGAAPPTADEKPSGPWSLGQGELPLKPEHVGAVLAGAGSRKAARRLRQEAKGNDKFFVRSDEAIVLPPSSTLVRRGTMDFAAPVMLPLQPRCLR